MFQKRSHQRDRQPSFLADNGRRTSQRQGSQSAGSAPSRNQVRNGTDITRQLVAQTLRQAHAQAARASTLEHLLSSAERSDFLPTSSSQPLLQPAVPQSNSSCHTESIPVPEPKAKRRKPTAARQVSQHTDMHANVFHEYLTPEWCVLTRAQPSVNPEENRSELLGAIADELFML